MVKSNIEWSDIGSWNALWKISDKDNNGNCYDGEIISIKTFSFATGGCKTFSFATGGCNSSNNLVVFENDDVYSSTLSTSLEHNINS